ncbi:nucleotidyltransferase family protein [Alteromonas sp. a30]|uniref:nucleotidyltransferase family protein n=1 Tax=Alteromonas sp. a30 TaxID=2730917 RepID=UPI00228209B6|nr:nucleotidyltransferase family protein [Alteromonas sp. a30]MCY7296710.1 nucleotidyltransferase family protein [Alteromonas sp. a30]
MNNINVLREIFLDFIVRGDTRLFDEKLSENEWQTIVKWCKEHRLTYVFIHKVKQSNAVYSKLHNSHLEQLENKANKAPLRQLKIQANLLHLHKILSENKIDYQVLKGSILAFKYYPNATIRRMRDIDIIVKPQCFSQACTLLLEHGYVFGNNAQHINYDTYIASAKHAPHLIHPDFNIIIEVHHRLCRPNLKPVKGELSAHPDFWQESDLVTVGNQSLPCESPEMLLTHIIHHSVRENAFNNGPVFIFDLYFLMTNNPIRWDKFHDYCGYMDLHKEAAIAFSLLLYFYPEIEIGTGLNASKDENKSFTITPDATLINACKHLMLCDLEQKQYERLSSALQSKSIKDKFTHLTKLLLPSKEKMNQHLGLNSSRYYWLLLPVWWLFLLKLLSTQFLGGDTNTKTTHELTALYRWLNK